MRAGSVPSVWGNLVLLLSIATGGCNWLRSNNQAQAGKARAEVKREQAACGSPSAGDRLKNTIFDEAIAMRNGDRANLDVLADYSVARLQDPVVKSQDRSLDITRCSGRFILEVPPGAERGFAGERQLQADVDYTAQASADGAGLVYRQKGAEPIIARLAAFSLASGAYRPSPAIDEAQGRSEVADQTTAPEPTAAAPAISTSAEPAPSVLARRPTQSTVPAPFSRTPLATRTPTERRQTEPVAAGSGGEATVSAFYGALGAGNGAAASSQVIPEKRSSGAFSPGAISRFYGRLPDPLRLTAVVPLAGGAYRVTYRYSAGRSRCNGTAIVRLTNRGGRDLIRSIQSLSGC